MGKTGADADGSTDKAMVSDLRKRVVTSEQSVRKARATEADASKRAEAANRALHEARSRFATGALTQIELDKAVETDRRDQAALALARTTLADAEAAALDAASAIENLESDLVQTGRLDDNLEALILRLREEKNPNPLTAALRSSLEALKAVRAPGMDGNPVADPKHPAHAALLQSVHHLMGYLTSTPQGAEKLFTREGGLVYVPDEAAPRRASTAGGARERFQFEAVPVMFRGQLGKAWGNIYLDR